MPGVGALALATAAAGLFVPPLVTTAYLIVDETAPPEARVQAGAWGNTALNAGGTAGAAVAGALAGWLPPGPCFAAPGGVTLLTVLSVTQDAARGGRAEPPAPSCDVTGMPALGGHAAE